VTPGVVPDAPVPVHPVGASSRMEIGSVLLSSEELVQAVVLRGGEWLLKIGAALLILYVGRFLARSGRRVVQSAAERARVDATLRSFLGNLSFWGIMILVGIAVLGTLGIEILSFVAILGAAGLAVGLAFQGTLSNFASGIMLLLFRPFSLGQGVSVGGITGIVKDMGLFSLTLDTFDGIRVVVPNSKVYGETITNFSTNPTRRFDLMVGVSYDDDLALAETTIRRVLESEDRVLSDPAPEVAVTELGDSSVNFLVRGWATSGDFWGTRWDVTRRLKEELEAAGCSIPYPQRDLHIVSGSAA
jgi:small conductance mechanosensitive channel